MGKSGKGLSIFALLIAIGALGLGVYQIILPTSSEGPNNAVIKNLWYTEKLDSIYFVPTIITEIPDLNIMATVNDGESLYISFNSAAAVYLSGLELIKIQLKINTVIYTNPFVELGGSSPGNVYSPMNLQYSIDTLPAGSYNISICAFSTDTGNWIKEMTLLVYTYI